MSCIVHSCNVKRDQGKSLFRVPKNDPNRLKLWLYAVRRPDLLLYKRSFSNSFVCEDHFSKECFASLVCCSKPMKRLKTDASPSLPPLYDEEPFLGRQPTTVVMKSDTPKKQEEEGVTTNFLIIIHDKKSLETSQIDYEENNGRNCVDIVTAKKPAFEIVVQEHNYSIIKKPAETKENDQTKFQKTGEVSSNNVNCELTKVLVDMDSSEPGTFQHHFEPGAFQHNIDSKESLPKLYPMTISGPSLDNRFCIICRGTCAPGKCFTSSHTEFTPYNETSQHDLAFIIKTEPDADGLFKYDYVSENDEVTYIAGQDIKAEKTHVKEEVKIEDCHCPNDIT